jgi:hypothetical protein
MSPQTYYDHADHFDTMHPLPRPIIVRDRKVEDIERALQKYKCKEDGDFIDQAHNDMIDKTIDAYKDKRREEEEARRANQLEMERLSRLQDLEDQYLRKKQEIDDIYGMHKELQEGNDPIMHDEAEDYEDDYDDDYDE